MGELISLATLLVPERVSHPPDALSNVLFADDAYGRYSHPLWVACLQGSRCLCRFLGGRQGGGQPGPYREDTWTAPARHSGGARSTHTSIAKTTIGFGVKFFFRVYSLLSECRLPAILAPLPPQEDLSRFRDMSGRFRDGRLSAEDYLKGVQSLGLSAVIPDLCGLLPDAARRDELSEAAARAIAREAEERERAAAAARRMANVVSAARKARLLRRTRPCSRPTAFLRSRLLRMHAAGASCTLSQLRCADMPSSIIRRRTTQKTTTFSQQPSTGCVNITGSSIYDPSVKRAWRPDASPWRANALPTARLNIVCPLSSLPPLFPVQALGGAGAKKKKGGASGGRIGVVQTGAAPLRTVGGDAQWSSNAALPRSGLL